MRAEHFFCVLLTAESRAKIFFVIYLFFLTQVQIFYIYVVAYYNKSWIQANSTSYLCHSPLPMLIATTYTVPYHQHNTVVDQQSC